jgi:hypothetical protein
MRKMGTFNALHAALASPIGRYSCGARMDASFDQGLLAKQTDNILRDWIRRTHPSSTMAKAPQGPGLPPEICLSPNPAFCRAGQNQLIATLYVGSAQASGIARATEWLAGSKGH